MKPTFTDDLSIILWLDNDDTGNSINTRAAQEGFRRQDKRHITILSGSTKDTFKEILNRLSEEEQKNILQKIKESFESLEWKFKPISGEVYKIKRTGNFDLPDVIESRESYIQMIDIRDMAIFYDHLNSLLKSNLPVQVPHITLYTKGEREKPEYYGIGICSKEDFESYSPEKVFDK